MAKEYDLVIRNGLVADGTGSAPISADIGIAGDRITHVGRIGATGREEIDAKGLLVTPGFVDVHTHYDGQVSWTSRLAPSSQHGATTVVMGNCGVGFAPCKPHERELLIKVMEGVEDIPGAVLNEGVSWEWETFPEYLDALEKRHYDIDFGTQVPHSPVRVYAMGRRGAQREPATAADMALMSSMVQDGIHAGALGFTSSRTMIHRLRDGSLAPSITAGEDELKAIALGMRAIGKGVLQGVDDWSDSDDAFAMWRRIAEWAQRPFSFTLVQRGQQDTTWLDRLEKVREANAAGLKVKGQVIGRPIGLLFGLDASYHAFTFSPSYRALESLPLADRIREMQRPEVRALLLAEPPDDYNPEMVAFLRNFENCYPFGDPPDYAPAAEDSIAARARRSGKAPLEHAYDLLLERGGHALFYHPVTNFGNNNLDNALTMMRDPNTILGIGDGGAHYGLVCDASATTYMLTYWTRDRKGERMSIPEAVKKLTRDTAAALGLNDRGILAPGYKADVNLIDYDRLHLHAPRMVGDLPAGGRRLMQEVDGYAATIVSGVVTYRDGKPTGTLPGRLIRGAQPSPN